MKRISGVLVTVFILLFQAMLITGIGKENGDIGNEIPTTRDSPYITENSSSISIGNDHLEIVLAKNVKCGISRIIDKATGIDLRGNKVPPPVILMLRYWTGNSTDIVIQWDAEELVTKTDESSSQATLTLEYRKFRGRNLNATVTIHLKKDEKFADFKLHIENDENFTVNSLFFPMIWGLHKIGESQEDDRLFYPVGDGLLLKNPLKYRDDLHMTEIYPSTASMQMMCLYDDDETGFFLTTDDSQGHPKKPSVDWMEWSYETHMAMFFEHLIPEFSGNDFQMEYNCRIGTFEGDWYDAAVVYRKWAVTTDLLSGGKVFESKDIPEWWAKTSVVSSSNRDADWIHTSLSDIENITGEFNDLTGINTTHLIFAWANEGAWCGPYYFPPAAGEKNFTDSMENIMEIGGHPFLYISGSVWRITRGDIGYSDYDLFNDIGRQWACIDQYGNPTIDQGYLVINWTSARMCPMTEFWHDMVVNNTLNCLDLGVDVVQIDEFPIGSIYPCYNESHGHTLGYSREIPDAYRSILAEARTLGRLLNPDFILSMEEPCEYYLPYMDTYVSRDNAPEFLIYPIAVELYGNDMEYIPFFSHVYHEYITAFSEPIPMNYDYPEPFTDQMRRSLARAFVTGEIISGSADEMENLRPSIKELYNRTVRASAGYCNDYLIKGKPLRPPRIEVPDQTVQWYFYSNESSGRPFEERSVLHSSWEADSGDLGHVFVNWVDSDVEFDVEIGEYDLGDGNHSLIVTRNGEREVLLRRTKLPVSITLKTDPGDVVLVEVTKKPDIDFGKIEVEAERILTNDTYVIGSMLENIGSKGSGPFSVQLFIDGEKIDSLDHPGLEESEKSNVSFNWDTTGLLGEVTIGIMCDLESNDLDLFNNERWKIIEVLERPRSDLRIIVNDSRTGLPLENVTVKLERMVPYHSLTGVTDIDGEVLFNNIIAGNLSISLFKDHFRDENRKILVSEGRNISLYFDLMWKQYPYLQGIVMDNSTGEPIEGAWISLFSIDNSSKELLSTMNSTSMGEFNFTELEEGGEYVVVVELEGYHLYSRSYHPYHQMGEIEVRLDRLPPVPGKISGKVVDNKTGIPIQGVEVTIQFPSHYSVTDEEGEFHFMDLHPGNYTLILSMEGYWNNTSVIEVLENDTTTVIIHLVKIKEDDSEPEPELFDFEGRILDEDGNPVDNVDVVILELQMSTKTNATGHFRFVNITEGEYTLIVSKDGFIDLNIKISTGAPLEDMILKEEEVGADPSPNYLFVVILAIAILVILGAVLIYTKLRGSGPEEE